MHALLTHLLCLSTLVEQSPKAIDLVFNIFRMIDEALRILCESLALLRIIFFILAEVVRYLYEPHGRTHEDIEVLGMWLHIRHCLYARGT